MANTTARATERGIEVTLADGRGSHLGSFLEFMQWLSTLGPKLPQAMLILQHVVDDLRQLADLFSVTPHAERGATVVTPEEEKLEAELEAQALVSEGRAASDGRKGFLRDVWSFILSNPELLAILIRLMGV